MENRQNGIFGHNHTSESGLCSHKSTSKPSRNQFRAIPKPTCGHTPHGHFEIRVFSSNSSKTVIFQRLITFKNYIAQNKFSRKSQIQKIISKCTKFSK